jgi:hypothetical protein
LFKPLWKSFDRQFGEVVQKFRAHKENVEREAGVAHMIEAADERAAQRDARSTALTQREAGAREKKGNEDSYFTPVLIIVIRVPRNLGGKHSRHSLNHVRTRTWADGIFDAIFRGETKVYFPTVISG